MIHPFRGRSRAAILLALLILTAPVYARAVATAGTDAPRTRLEAGNEQGYRGVLTFAAAPLVTMRPTPFRLVLFDPRGRRTTAPEIACDLTMPAMPMPDNRPPLTPGETAYSGEAIFTMAGAWRVSILVLSAGGAQSRLIFDIDRVLLK